MRGGGWQPYISGQKLLHSALIICIKNLRLTETKVVGRQGVLVICCCITIFPQTWQLKTTFLSHNLCGLGIRAQLIWVFCLGSHKNVMRVLAKTEFSSGALGKDPHGSWQCSVPCSCRTENFSFLLAVSQNNPRSLPHGVGERVCLLPYSQQEREISKTGTTFLYSVMIYILSVGQTQTWREIIQECEHQEVGIIVTILRLCPHRRYEIYRRYLQHVLKKRKHKCKCWDENVFASFLELSYFTTRWWYSHQTYDLATAFI